MPNATRPWLSLLLASLMCWTLLALSPAHAQQSRLVDAAWLQKNLADVLLLDASVTPQHMAAHIPGAVSADLYRYGPSEPTRAAMQNRMQSWGVSPGRKIVVYDQGGDMMGTRLVYDLYYNGVPAQDIFLLDGGLAKWRAAGGAVTKDATPAPARGSHVISAVREEVRSRLPEFLVASGDRSRHALVEALEPNYHYGVQKFFNRAGHVPGAVLMPSEDFFNADKTFKSADDIRRMLRYQGITPEHTVHSHCGGGVAASVPWFALHFLVGHPKTKLYLESQREWLRDERQLPYWTYSAPQRLRSSAWVDGWNAPMMRMFGVAQLNIVDVRAPDKYAQGHIAYALSLPADTLRSHLGQADKLAALLGPAGVNPAHEVVVVAENGLTPSTALAMLAFEQLGHKQVSVLTDSLDEWGLRGFALTKQPTVVGAPKAPTYITVPPTTYTAPAPTAVLTRDPGSTSGEYAKVFIASGKAMPARTPQGRVLHLPYSDMLGSDGAPKAAKDLWTLLNKAGVPRHAEVIVFADDVAEAAVNYVVFKLMGWPDVKVWMP
jgi:thiosulfate/3-mercaptopyruvate sulfurtransferase